MPVSTSVHISHCLSHIITLQPRSVLDVGLGFGLWGFLCREYLDVMNERVGPDTWQVRIDGIEFWEPYIQAHQRALHNHIAIGDIRELAPTLPQYDLIIAGDVIEHLEKRDGLDVLAHLYAKADRALLVNIPLGEGWEHPEAHGNPGELHRSQWSVEDFAEYTPLTQLFRLPCGKYGVFYCKKDASTMERVNALHDAAVACESEGNLAGAIAHLERAHTLSPEQEGIAMHLADILLREGQLRPAIRAMEETIEANPNFHYGRLALARIFIAARRLDEARAHLLALLARDDVSTERLQEAQTLLDGLPSKR